MWIKTMRGSLLNLNRIESISWGEDKNDAGKFEVVGYAEENGQFTIARGLAKKSTALAFIDILGTGICDCRPYMDASVIAAEIH